MHWSAIPETADGIRAVVFVLDRPDALTSHSEPPEFR